MSMFRFLRRWFVLTLLTGGVGLLEFLTLPHGGFVLAGAGTLWLYVVIVRALFRAWLWDMEQGWFYWLSGRRGPGGRW